MAARRRRRAFSLLELLVVIGIIGVLITISVVVGSAVTAGAKQRLTEDTIRVLDASMEAFVKSNGSIPDPWTRITDQSTSTSIYLPVADARNMSDSETSLLPPGNQILNSVGLYIGQAALVPEAQTAIATLPSRAVRRVTNTIGGTQVTLTTAIDGWGRPIRYVHPAFQGAWANRASPSSGNAAASQVNSTNFPDLAGAPSTAMFMPAMIRRNNKPTVAPPNQVNAQDYADSDGGRCTGSRPYFYSAGADGLADTTKDNVYTTPPTF
ncbi:MAG: prepilin-type N-terminal cleavage/methylation domain-containing protein [Tepidisphaera sp.]|nr:prepilin-type N-terminal cleavage/methylation domain-containing protein [Tepidisphaera sp.]